MCKSAKISFKFGVELVTHQISANSVQPFKREEETNITLTYFLVFNVSVISYLAMPRELYTLVDN